MEKIIENRQHKELRIRGIAAIGPVVMWSGSRRHIYPWRSIRGGDRLRHLTWQESHDIESEGPMKGLTDGRLERAVLLRCSVSELLRSRNGGKMFCLLGPNTEAGIFKRT